MNYKIVLKLYMRTTYFTILFLIFTNLYSSFHNFLAISHICHAKFAKFLVQKPSLALPEAAFAVDDTCGYERRYVTLREVCERMWAAPVGTPATDY